ncbi:MAG: hypothetical protein ACN4GM_09745 [Gammaproteobacteria bacterium]
MKLLSNTDNEILNTLIILAENMENGWNENDYVKFSKDQTDEFRKQVDIHEFNKQRNDAYGQLGSHEIIDFVTLHKNPDNIIIIWKMKFEKRDEHGLAIYYFKEINDKAVISGAMFHA